MSIQQTKQQSDLEKRLQLLRRQVYGKSSENSKDFKRSDNLKIQSSDLPGTLSSSGPLQNDVTYLYQDLLKILIFSSIAIGIQFVLFFLMKNSMLNFIH